GAKFLGMEDRIGSIAVGKQADLFVVRGDPSQKISDLENGVAIFKRGHQYDPAALVAAVRESVGMH
ncbi:MAG: amidohydrolase family protein, partial [Terriglobales bacterium]